MSDRKYVIINVNESNSINFDQVLETSINTLRYNNDNTQTFVNFTGDTPSFLDGKTQYTYSEIIAIINDENGDWWIEDETGDTTDDTNQPD